MVNVIVASLARHNELIVEGVKSVMGGKILNYEAKDILNRGRQEGLQEGLKEGRREGIEKGKLEVALDMLKEKLSLDMIARITKLPTERVVELATANGLSVC